MIVKSPGWNNKNTSTLEEIWVNNSYKICCGWMYVIWSLLQVTLLETTKIKKTVAVNFVNNGNKTKLSHTISRTYRSTQDQVNDIGTHTVDWEISKTLAWIIKMHETHATFTLTTPTLAPPQPLQTAEISIWFLFYSTHYRLFLWNNVGFHLTFTNFPFNLQQT